MGAKTDDTILLREVFKPVDEPFDDQLPWRFADALGEVRATIRRCDEHSFRKDTMLPALLRELIRLCVDAYGLSRMVYTLNQLANELSSPSFLSPESY